MSPETDRIVAVLFHGWMELVTLFVLQVCLTGAIGWAANLKRRPADRASLVPWPSLVMAFAAIALIRPFGANVWGALVVCAGLVASSVVGQRGAKRGLAPALMAVALLLGLGQVLSALLLAATVTLVLVIASFGRQ
jgi:hypothetical protein